jgi:CheY-like chemotaxis protein
MTSSTSWFLAAEVLATGRWIGPPYDRPLEIYSRITTKSGELLVGWAFYRPRVECAKSLFNMGSLSGLRLLIVEDDALVALNLQEFVESLGCSVVGPTGRLSEAFAIIDAEHIDGAMLDINLHGEMVYPLAERLAERDVPILFCSGYAFTSAVPEQFAHYPQVAKPCVEQTLRTAMMETFGYLKAPPPERGRAVARA